MLIEPGRISRRMKDERRAVAAMEFAMVAPIMLLMIWGVYDVSRALLAWEETFHAAQAIAQAAEKMSVTNTFYLTGVNAGKPITSLTSQEMQNAMTTIFAEMPWLNQGAGSGSFPGQFAVSLSGVSYLPVCPANVTGTCAKQIPNVIWSTYLTFTSPVPPQLIQPTQSTPNLLYRLCGALKTAPKFPNDSTQLLYMIDPTMATGVQTNLIPQVVADVEYVFRPSFPLLSGTTYTFYASASFPAPLGGDDQAIVYDATDSTGLIVVENCAGGNSI